MMWIFQEISKYVRAIFSSPGWSKWDVTMHAYFISLYKCPCCSDNNIPHRELFTLANMFILSTRGTSCEYLIPYLLTNDVGTSLLNLIWVYLCTITKFLLPGQQGIFPNFWAQCSLVQKIRKRAARLKYLNLPSLLCKEPWCGAPFSKKVASSYSGRPDWLQFWSPRHSGIQTTCFIRHQVRILAANMGMLSVCLRCGCVEKLRCSHSSSRP